MLGLKCDTNPEWIVSALENLDSVIIDHAHAEKKAALTAMNLINNYPGKNELSYRMADIVEEEIDHYRRVLKILENRNVQLPMDKGDDYAKQLFVHLRKSQPQRFLDHLLVAGIIEARSCERLQILAANIEDEELKSFYTELAHSEAGHYTAFTKLARLYFPEDEVKERINELTDIEAEIVKNLSNKPLMHG